MSRASSPRRCETQATYLFRSTGTVVKFPGHTIVYMEGVDKELFTQKPSRTEEVEDDAERQLPELTEGERLRLVEQEGQTVPGVLSKQHFTQPPPRYNEALLIKELEEKGIGRPSTYASHHFDDSRSQICRERGRAIPPTETGRTVNDFLMKGFPDLINVDFTSQLEEELDEVEEGNKPWVTPCGTFTDLHDGSGEGEDHSRAQRYSGATDGYSLREMRPNDGDQMGTERQVSRLSCV